jgi:hypothetical protein
MVNKPETALTGELALLDPKEVRLWRERGSFPRMQLGNRVCYGRVRLAWAFPLSDRDRHVSVLDWNGREIGLLERLADLDEASRRVAVEELERRYYTPLVRRVRRVRWYFEVLSFDVETDRGRRQFDVKSHRTNIVPIGPDRYLITDIDGNRYEIRDVRELDPGSFGRIESLI